MANQKSLLTMRYFLWLAGLLLLIMSLHGRVACAAAAGRDGDIDRILEAFQTEAYLKDAFAWFRTALQRKKGDEHLSVEQVRFVESLAKRIYTPKNLIDVLREAYAKQTTPANVATLSNWLKTPKGIKLRRAYKNAYGGAKVGEPKDSGARPAPTTTANAVNVANRQNAVHTYMETWHQDDLHATCLSSLDFAVLMAFAALKKANLAEAAAALKLKVEQSRVGMINQSRIAMQAFDTRLLREFSQDEIDDYVAFATSPTGEAHVKGSVRAFGATFDAAAKTLANQISKGEFGP